MFELSLSTSIDKQKHICDIYKNLFLMVKTDGGVIAKHNHQNRSYVVIAVPENKKEYYKSRILDLVVIIIVNYYKYNFFKDFLALDSEDNILNQAFLKAVSVFDYDFDKEFIKRQIELKNEVCIDSFFFFKLQDLKNKWQKAAFVIKQNNIIVDDDSILEILRHLSLSAENNTLRVDIFAGKNKITIKNLYNKKLFKNNNKGYSSFLTELILLNPKKINLKVSKQNSGFGKVLNALNKIYADKIYLQS